MSKEPAAGDHVKWKGPGGTAHGKVVKKLTAESHIKSHKVAASKDSPEFLVETKGGKRAAHKAEALKREG